MDIISKWGCLFYKGIMKRRSGSRGERMSCSIFLICNSCLAVKQIGKCIRNALHSALSMSFQCKTNSFINMINICQEEVMTSYVYLHSTQKNMNYSRILQRLYTKLNILAVIVNQTANIFLKRQSIIKSYSWK